MTDAPTDHLLDEDAVDRLEDFLASEIFHGEAMRLDELQGFLCALLGGPESPPPEAWLPVALGEAPAFRDEAEAREFQELLMRFRDHLAAQLEAGEDPVLIVYDPEEGEHASGLTPWCDGYLLGTELSPVDWVEAAGEHAEDMVELLEDFYLLEGSLKEDAEASGGPWMSEAQEARLMDEAAARLAARVVEIHDFWRIKRQPAMPLRRESPKVGRNDPCPCGSGRKFKQCCGRPDRLH
ncbi:MAG: UPF0149 family protein [Rhodocyclaceae bacterium]|nr:UPF0149 family protein [Rhodocyclaceae bacterium]